MKLNVAKEVAALQRMTMRELRARFAVVFGEATPTGNRVWLVKRIAWRLQALVEGDLSERARKRAAELANDADLRLYPPRPPRPDALPTTGCDRQAKRQGLPMPGTTITRVYRGETLQVKVLPEGFEFGGKAYSSLSAVAKAITGSHCSGFLFFRLKRKDGSR